MASQSWTIRFENYYPVDDSMEERLQRVCEDIGSLPSSAVNVDKQQKLITIDYAQIHSHFEASRQILRTIRAGEHLVVKPPWEPYEPAAGEILLEIDPGVAFGSGLHETTRLCLQALEKHVCPGCKVMDFGTGAGILAIAAAKLGAGSVTAFDIHPEAVETAEANVKRNGVEAVVETHESGDLEGIGSAYDLIVANLMVEVIVPYSAGFAGVLRNGGTLICSGVTDRNMHEVEPALKDAGFRIMETLTEGHWVALVATINR